MRVYEFNGVRVEVDFIKNREVFFRRWESGSDGSIDGDFKAFLGAGRMPVSCFRACVGSSILSEKVGEYVVSARAWAVHSQEWMTVALARIAVVYDGFPSYAVQPVHL